MHTLPACPGLGISFVPEHFVHLCLDSGFWHLCTCMDLWDVGVFLWTACLRHRGLVHSFCPLPALTSSLPLICYGLVACILWRIMVRVVGREENFSVQIDCGRVTELLTCCA